VLNVQTADAIVSTVTFTLAYVICASVAGALAAWIVALLGDKTAQSHGFTSLNPLVHVDTLGFFCFYLTGLGWFRRIPINMHHLGPRFRIIKVIAAFLTESAIHILFATIAILGLTAYFGTQIFMISLPMLARYEYLSHRILTAAYPNVSSLVIVLAFVVISFIYINVMLATLSLLFKPFFNSVKVTLCIASSSCFSGYIAKLSKGFFKLSNFGFLHNCGVN
jgi:hypothetical protein